MSTAVESITQTVSDFKDKIMGTDPVQLSGEEPLSGAQGNGTVSDPYDRGNLTEPAQLGEEPPSGVQGKGTMADPYDAGNAPGKLHHLLLLSEPY
jgi:hypothetical protein